MSNQTEGARLLRLVMKTGQLTHEDVERRIRSGRGVVSRYLSGERTPDRARAAALLREFNIPLSAWDEPPSLLSPGEVV